MIDKETPSGDSNLIPIDTIRLSSLSSVIKHQAFVMGLAAGIAFTMSVYAFARTYFSSKTPAPTQQCAPPLQVQTLDTICGSGQERFVEVNGERFYSLMDEAEVRDYCQ